tara:strand:- start:222 stop:431 length:210 start_codon:yes stop_codon:yes gene_type:complete
VGIILFILYLFFIGWLLAWAEGAGGLGVIVVMAVSFFIMYLFFSSGVAVQAVILEIVILSGKNWNKILI